MAENAGCATSENTVPAATGPTLSTAWALAWPLALNGLLLQAVLIVDTVLVTPLGEQSLAAMGLAASLASLVIGSLFAFSNGTQLIVAQAVGAGHRTAIKAGFWSGLIINLLVATVGICLIQFAAGNLLHRLAESTFIANQAMQYLSIFCLVFLGVAVSQNLTAFFNASGNSRVPFYSNLIELPINASLSFMLIHGYGGLPAMGLAGAAVGTLVAVVVRSCFLMVCLNSGKQSALLDRAEGAGRWPAFRWPACRWPAVGLLHDLRLHFAQAWPIAGSFISMTLSLSVCMLFYSRLGLNQFAALTLIFPWVRVGGQIVTSWAQATGILVGQILGRGQMDILDEFVGRAWRFSFYLGALVAASFLLMVYLFQWIYPDLQPETLGYLWQLLPLLLLLPLLRTSNTLCGNLLRAGGDAAYSMKVHMGSQWLVTVPLSVLFVVYLNLSVFWIYSIILLEEIIKAFPFHRRVYSGRWKRQLHHVST